MIAPIDTYYNGNYFRSRLEARWAVYFEELGVRYQYEKEGYSFGEFYYLPDFYFPDYGFYGEVKYDGFGDSDAKRWEQFSKEIGKPLIIFEGLPHAKKVLSYGFFDFEADIIPFADKAKKSFGHIWCDFGNNDLAMYDIFETAILKARTQRFEHL